MPNVTGVQILQGAQEYGKDLIFYIPGGLSEPLLCSCVVKNVAISGKVGSSSGARTVFLQAQQALDTPHITGLGAEEFVQRVYIVTPHPIDPATMAAIKGALRESRGQVSFVGGSALFDLFKKYWPDFIADEADAIAHYLNSSERDLEAGHPMAEVAAMYNLGSIDKAAAWIHVPQLFSRTVTSFVPGDAIDELFKLDQLDLEMTRQDIRRWQTMLQRLDSVFTTIADWEFITRSESTSFRQKSDRFIELWESAWSLEIQAKLQLRSDEVPKVSPEACVRLPEESEIRGLALDLRGNANELLANGLDRFSDSARAFIESPDLESEWIADEQFADACALTDLALLLPGGFLEEGDKRTWQFDLDSIGHELTFLLVGAAGYGKSSFCRWHFLQDAERLRCQDSEIVPVYVPLHKTASSNPSTFEDLYQHGFGVSALLSSATEYANKPLRIYFDGLDEVANEPQRESLIRLIKTGVEARDDVQVVITARDYVNASYLRWLPRFSLTGFSQEQISRFVGQWFKGKDEESSRFNAEIQKAPGLADLMSVPLLATLIVLVFRQTRRLPENRSKVYEIFTDLMCEGWNLAKGILRPSRFGVRTKKAVLGKLAISCHRNRSRLFKDSDVADSVSRCVAKSVCADWTELRDEMLQDCLINRSGGAYQFPHLSFQEFLAARELLGEPNHTQLNEAVDEFLTSRDDWWLETLRFYIGLCGAPQETYSWIVEKAGAVSQAETREDDELKGDDERVDVFDRAEELLSSVRQIFPEAPMRI